MIFQDQNTYQEVFQAQSKDRSILGKGSGE
jgi:hypothetical protein